MSVPGGHIDCEPPQHPHRKPSTAQCRQYSQDEASPGSALGAAAPAAAPGLVSAPRATGSNGTAVAPKRKDPRPASTLRLDVRRASARAEFSDNASNHFMNHSPRDGGGPLKRPGFAPPLQNSLESTLHLSAWLRTDFPDVREN